MDEQISKPPRNVTWIVVGAVIGLALAVGVVWMIAHGLVKSHPDPAPKAGNVSKPAYGITTSKPLAPSGAFNVILKAGGEKKISVIKVVRAVTGLGLRDAKDLVDGAPRTVKEGISRQQAEDIKRQLEEVGATVEITPQSTATRPARQAASRPAPASQPATAPLAPAAAMAAYGKGLELLKAGDMLGARVQLSEALYSGKLDAPAEAIARGELARLANALVFSSEVLAGDPYSLNYTVLPGDMLIRVEKRQDLRVPAQMILLVNGLSRAEDIRSGRRIKLVRGPVCAVVSKSRFLMDLYLKRDDLPPVWVASMPVGLGKNGSTPPGMWRLTKGGKLVRPVWNPPPSSDVKSPVSYGQEGYALGQKGLWMALEGTDDATRDKSDYGIHSTSDQTSIGKEGSLGCIRLADKDIELAFALLYDLWSTVEVRP